MSDKMSPIDLLRKFHEHADKFDNHVSTDELYWAGADVISLCRKWYSQSDLRKQTIEVLSQQTPGA